MSAPAAAPFELDASGQVLRGEEIGEGPAVVLAHGLTATREQVLHGSKALPRAGYRVASYDARGHGESEPAPKGESYGYEFLSADLAATIADRAGESRVVAVGHSMGTHTVAALALANPDRFAGVVLAGPVSLGLPPTEEVLADWDELADGMEEGGVEGFMAVYEARERHPDWNETVIGFTRRRLQAHKYPHAVAKALREVPRSLPFEGIGELENLEVPALVVASRDEADPGHPYAVAEAWAEAVPQARLVGEDEGEAPLAWRGGLFAREVAAFAAEPAVAERLAA